MSRRIACVAAVALPLALAAVGCALADAAFGLKKGEDEILDPAPPGVFSHLHHRTVVATCGLCHRPSGGGQYYLTPGTICQDCHVDEPGWGPDADVLARVRVVGPYHHDRHFEKARAAGMPADACTDCHRGIESSDHRSKRKQKNLPTMEGCFTCHARLATMKGKAGTECVLCHVPGDFREPMFEALRAALLAGRSQDELDRALIPESHLRFMEPR